MPATTNFTAKDVQELRQRTGAGMMDCKKALEECQGDAQKASDLLRTRGMAKAEKRNEKEASEGRVASYIHHNHRVGVLVEVNCETDFVANTDDFKTLVRELAIHIASSAPLAVDRSSVPVEVIERERRIYEEQTRAAGKPDHLIGRIVDGKIESYYKQVALLSQPWVKDDKKTIEELVKETSAKVGEKIAVRRFARFRVGGE
ncbi:MAG: translation elongation factor Ts [Gemmatimonadota bacterium]|nr:translation elongation factor Ts [Gemmatimonadota bacterium]